MLRSNWKRPGLVIGMLAAVGLLGIAANQVGGIAIRSDGADFADSGLAITEPILPGVPTVLEWGNLAQADETVEVGWRGLTGEVVLTTAPAMLSKTPVLFPCTGEETGTLFVRERGSRKILAQQEVVLLKPTAECALRGL